jgi:hypothetical protein
MRKNQPPTSPTDLIQRIKPFLGRTFLDVSQSENVPFTGGLQGKGVVGHWIEDLVGLPRDNDRLDFPWGDLKSKFHHVGKEIGGCVVGSLNSLAAEMIEEDTPFEEFILGKKISQTVLVTYCTNRRGGGAAGEGWEKFTFETVNDHVLRNLPQWEGVKEDWEVLKEYTRSAYLSDGFVSSSKKGPNDFLAFNSCGGSFSYGGRNLRRRSGIQLKLGKTLVRELCS